jgi:hypothetical protein
LKAGDGQREGHHFQNLGITYDVIQNKLEDSIRSRKSLVNDMWVRKDSRKKAKHQLIVDVEIDEEEAT